MRELLKKAGSLALGIGALALVSFNAAVSHGCGGSRAEPVTQAGPEPTPAPTTPTPSAAPVTSSANAAPSAAADPDCEQPSYMHATKAPVFVPEKCRPAAGAKVSEPAVSP